MLRAGVRSFPSRRAHSGYGPELIVNGTFGTDTSGWTTNTATFVAAAGVATLTNSAAAGGYAYQSITTVVGARYRLTGDITIGTATLPRLVAGTGGFGSSDLGLISVSASGSYAVTFIATNAATFITATPNSVVAGQTAIYDNVSVKQFL